jgi:LysM repeat protein
MVDWSIWLKGGFAGVLDSAIILKMTLRKWSIFLMPAILLMLSACSSNLGSNSLGDSTPTFQFYRTDTPTPSRTPTVPGTSTPLPSPSPTPRTHPIAKGDTFSGIAFQFGVSIPALQAANPGLDPNMLIVGTVVFIPPPGTPESGTPSIPSPTPVSLQVDIPVCYRSGDGGLWCFADVKNPQAFAVESVSGAIRIAGADGQVHSQNATLLLDVLPAGASLPLAAYFPAPIPDPVSMDAEINVVLPLNDNGQRYPLVNIENLVIEINPGGKIAHVSGEAVLGAPGTPVTSLWLALAAYDEQGNPVGVRRVEINQPFATADRQPFEAMVYAAGGQINQVQVLAQARK